MRRPVFTICISGPEFLAVLGTPKGLCQVARRLDICSQWVPKCFFWRFGGTGYGGTRENPYFASENPYLTRENPYMRRALEKTRFPPTRTQPVNNPYLSRKPVFKIWVFASFSARAQTANLAQKWLSSGVLNAVIHNYVTAIPEAHATCPGQKGRSLDLEHAKLHCL